MKICGKDNLLNHLAFRFRRDPLQTKEACMKRLTLISIVLIAVCATFVTPAAAQHEHPAGDPGKLGKVNFPVSCDPAVQLQFSSAVAMLHSF
jgi:hypothetical protein